MKTLMILAVILGLATGCHGQEEKDQRAQNKTAAQKPNEKWTVNKETDENGNIIKYDSIYSWSSSGNVQALSQKQMDSLMNGFGTIFQNDVFGENMGDIQDFFNNGSNDMDTIINQFFAQDSISGNSGLDAIRQQMQAMQQQFLQQARPEPIIPAEPEKTPKKSH